MKQWAVAIGASLAMACGGARTASEPAETVAARRSVASLAWLEGTWTSVAEDGSRTTEAWGPAAGGAMPGSSTTVGADGAPTGSEVLRIEESGDGIDYVAHPQGATSDTRFRATEIAPGRAVFENPAHDFPQRITYEIEPSGLLRATITDIAETNRMTWMFERQRE